MTEFNLIPEEVPPTPQVTPQHGRQGRWKRATLAGFLSLLVAGMGQVYNRQPRKALWLALPIPVFVIIGLELRAFFYFPAMVAFLSLLIGWRLWVAAEAAWGGWSAKRPESSLGRLGYFLVAALLVIVTLYPTVNEFKRWTPYSAFRVASGSMCPTVCTGERIMADMGAYKSGAPQRGDIVLLQNKLSSSPFIKRVVGVSGDVVEPDPDGNILVNGKRVIFPDACGFPIRVQESTKPYIFESTTVPDGAFFVVGDDIRNSNDSRYPDFGLVFRDQVRGKPLYLYWSPGRSRIGCSVR